MGEEALDALRAAVEAAPHERELRLVLTRYLLEAGRTHEALEQVALVLEQDPADFAALELAARAAQAAGLADRAVGYRRLLVALGGGSAQDTSTVEPEPPVAPGIPLHDEPPRDGGASPSPDASSIGAPDPERDTEGGHDPAPVQGPAITLTDVGGLDDVKQRLEATFLGPLRNAALRSAFGASLRGGLLLYGPPGCGKTFLARAVAGELAASFVSVGLTEVMDPYLGVSERQLHEHFEMARRAAPCVVFVDEIDALGQKRSQLRYSAARGIVNQLLTELDGIEDRNDGVFVLAATNHPWDVDTALRRPGRFDRTLLVLPPDDAARAAILALHLRDRPTQVLDLSRIARTTKDYSGADLALVCRTAVEYAMARSAAAGTVSPVTQSDLSRAADEVRPSATAWLEMAANYALYANQGGEYDELAAYLRQRKLL